MKHLTELSTRMFIDAGQVSFIDLEKKLDATGSAYMRAKVIVAGHQVILNESESEKLMTKLKSLGMIS